MFMLGIQRQVSSVVLIRQILFTGYEALTLVSVIAIAIGGIIIIQGHLVITGFANSDLLYIILVSVIVRELSGLMTAFIIISRSGTAISTELGNMSVNHEVESLTAMGISPISYLVAPRVFGVVVSMITLTIYFNVAGLLGGWAVSSLFVSVSIDDFFYKLLSEVTVTDMLAVLGKSIVFGLTVGLIASYHGLQVRYASTEVPQRTIKSVVHSLLWMVIIDVLFALGLYVI
ncbi:MAG: ABC transporter permease [Bacteroidetes bacterium]|nr:ABC transporter permease [Bacteroidota bacterium]